MGKQTKRKKRKKRITGRMHPIKYSKSASSKIQFKYKRLVLVVIPVLGGKGLEMMGYTNPSLGWALWGIAVMLLWFCIHGTKWPNPKLSEFTQNKYHIGIGYLLIFVVFGIISLYVRGQQKPTQVQLDQIISSQQEISDDLKKLINQEIEDSEQNHLVKLKEKYELGYALLYIDEAKDWYYIPRNMKRKLDWYSTKVESITEDEIVIQMPAFVLEPGNTILNSYVELDRRVGASTVFLRLPDLSIEVEVLEVSDASTIAVVGITQRKL